MCTYCVHRYKSAQNDIANVKGAQRGQWEEWGVIVLGHRTKQLRLKQGGLILHDMAQSTNLFTFLKCLLYSPLNVSFNIWHHL